MGDAFDYQHEDAGYRAGRTGKVQKCDYCGTTLEPTHALALVYPIKCDPNAFPWSCRVCRVASSEPVQHAWALDTPSKNDGGK